MTNLFQPNRRELFQALGATAIGASLDGLNLLAQDHTPPVLPKGGIFPDFTLPGISGEKVNFSKMTEGKLVLVEFWATWCGPCIKDIPVLHGLLDTWKGHSFRDPQTGGVLGKSFSVFSVALNQDEEQSGQWRKLHSDGKITGDAHVETSRSDVLEKHFGVLGLPHYYLIDGARRIVSRNIGLKQLELFLSEAAVSAP